MDVDPVRLLDNVRSSSDEDLLDRVTVYRAGMEDEAVRIITDELARRGRGGNAIRAHAERRAAETLMLADGTAARCSWCHKPATAEGWGWHRLWGKLPLFPRHFRYCDEHRPDRPCEAGGSAGE